MHNKNFIIAFIIACSVFALNGCSDTSKSTETIKHDNLVNETIEPQEDNAISAAEALEILNNSFEVNERGTRDYPDDYAGYYFDGVFGQNNYVLAVMITDESSARYDFLKDFEKVRFETAEHSLNELLKICTEMPSELIKEFGLPYMSAEIDMRQNVIKLVLDDTCTDKQRTVVNEYIKNKPITVRYAPKPAPELQ